MNDHPTACQSLDGVVRAAGIGHNPVVGIHCRACPTLDVRRFVQGDCVDRHFHITPLFGSCMSPTCASEKRTWSRTGMFFLPDEIASSFLPDCHETAEQICALQL